MMIDLVAPAQLTAAHIDRWGEIRALNDAFDSPFFAPEFTQAVAETREDIEVAVVSDAENIVGFFPFQRDSADVGTPVGFRLNDFQGVVSAADSQFDLRELVKACGLRCWHFDHLVASQTRNAAQHLSDGSPYIDLAGGAQAYFDERRAAGSSQIRQTERKARKMARELGPLRFEWHTAEPAAFAQLLEWKVAQQLRTGTRATMTADWVVELLKNVCRTKGGQRLGVLSALYAGDRLVAAHLGMVDGQVFHWWVPAYEAECANYSPGSILLVRLIEAAAERGIHRIDLGKGAARYKTSFMSGEVTLTEGSVHAHKLAGLCSMAWYRSKNWIRNSRYDNVYQAAKRTVRSWRQVPTKPLNSQCSRASR